MFKNKFSAGFLVLFLFLVSACGSATIPANTPVVAQTESVQQVTEKCADVDYSEPVYQSQSKSVDFDCKEKLSAVIQNGGFVSVAWLRASKSCKSLVPFSNDMVLHDKSDGSFKIATWLCDNQSDTTSQNPTVIVSEEFYEAKHVSFYPISSKGHAEIKQLSGKDFQTLNFEDGVYTAHS